MRINKICRLLPFAFSSMRDPYKILGISSNATKEEIKIAYYKKVKQHHPDVSGSASASKFDQVRKAFLDLSNPSSSNHHSEESQQEQGFKYSEERSRRAQRRSGDYWGNDDSQYYNWEEKQFHQKNKKREKYSQQQFMEWQFQQQQLRQFIKAFQSYVRNGYVKPKYQKYKPFMHFDTDDFNQDGDQYGEQEYQEFEDFQFESSQVKNKHKMKKMDISYLLKIKQEELGDEIKIKYQRQINCPKCQHNSNRNFSKKPCRDGQNGKHHDKNCKKCGGKGYTVKYNCKQCGNKGSVIRNVEQLIVVPLGVESGQVLTINGRGHQHRRKGTYGDLVVKIELTEIDSNRSRQRNGRSPQIDVNIFEAVLGCTTNVKSKKGNIPFNIPAGTQHGAILKNRSTNPNKDIKQIRINLIVPMDITNEERQLYEKLRKLNERNSSI